jgi:hypothetical protein
VLDIAPSKNVRVPVSAKTLYELSSYHFPVLLKVDDFLDSTKKFGKIND